MSSNDQPYIDPSEIPLEEAAVQRFKNPSHAFWSGIRDAAGAPAMVLFAGMVGFGAMGKTNGFDVWFTTFTSFFMFALPGQVVLLEMAITGSCFSDRFSGDANLNTFYHHDGDTLSTISSKRSQS